MSKNAFRNRVLCGVVLGSSVLVAGCADATSDEPSEEGAEALSLAARAPDWPAARSSVTVRDYAGFASALRNLSPGKHIIIADGANIDGPLLQITTSGTAALPIVIRAASPLGATLTAPIGVRADYVRFGWLKSVDPRTASKTQLGEDLATNDDIADRQFAIRGTGVEFHRMSFRWTKMGPSGHLAAIGVTKESSSFKALHCSFTFALNPNNIDLPRNNAGKFSEDSAYRITPILLMVRTGNYPNNRDAELAYNLFKDVPGGDLWEGSRHEAVARTTKYDMLIRGTVWSVGAGINSNQNARSSGLNIHHNLVLNSGTDTDCSFRVTCDGTCNVHHNTVIGKDGAIRVRFGRRINFTANWIEDARGFQIFGEDHVLNSNYVGAGGSILLPAGNYYTDMLDPWPDTQEEIRAIIRQPNDNDPNGRAAADQIKLYANRGEVVVGHYYRGDRPDMYAREARGTKIYSHRDSANRPVNAFGPVIKKMTPDRELGTTIAPTLPPGTVATTPVKLKETDVGPSS